MSDLWPALAETLARQTGEVISRISAAMRAVTTHGAMLTEEAGNAVANSDGAGARAIAGAAGDGRRSAVARAGARSTVVTGLGHEVDALVALSPTATRDVETLKARGWHIIYGGTSGSRTILDHKTICVDTALESHPEVAASELSHEISHAVDPPRFIPKSGTTQEFYARTNADIALDSEARAVLKNYEVVWEISRAAGRDLRVRQGALAAPHYAHTFERYLRGQLTRDGAISDFARFVRYDRTSTPPNLTYVESLRNEFAARWEQLTDQPPDVPHF